MRHMRRMYRIRCAEARFNCAMRFPKGTAKHADYMQLSWMYLFYAVGAPVLEER